MAEKKTNKQTICYCLQFALITHLVKQHLKQRLIELSSHPVYRQVLPPNIQLDWTLLNRVDVGLDTVTIVVSLHIIRKC